MLYSTTFEILLYAHPFTKAAYSLIPVTSFENRGDNDFRRLRAHFRSKMSLSGFR